MKYEEHIFGAKNPKNRHTEEGNRTFHFVCITLPLRQQGLVLGETLWQTISPKRGKWGHGSECPVSPTWETVSKRPRSFSPNPDYWCSLQSERTGRGWNIAARAEVIKETLLNTSLFFLLTISWTLSGILLMSHWGASSMNPSWPTVIPNTPNSSLTPFTLSVHPWPERASLCRQLMSKCRKLS